MSLLSLWDRVKGILRHPSTVPAEPTEPAGSVETPESPESPPSSELPPEEKTDTAQGYQPDRTEELEQKLQEQEAELVRLRATLREERDAPPREQADPHKQLEKLVGELTDLIKEFHDKIIPAGGPAVGLAEYVMNKLFTALQHSGIEVIRGEECYDPLRHWPVPFDETAQLGRPLAETLRPGVALDGKVLLRAEVRLAPLPLSPELEDLQ